VTTEEYEKLALTRCHILDVMEILSITRKELSVQIEKLEEQVETLDNVLGLDKE
jgi:hypothetical protein